MTSLLNQVNIRATNSIQYFRIVFNSFTTNNDRLLHISFMLEKWFTSPTRKKGIYSKEMKKIEFILHKNTIE